MTNQANPIEEYLRFPIPIGGPIKPSVTDDELRTVAHEGALLHGREDLTDEQRAELEDYMFNILRDCRDADGNKVVWIGPAAMPRQPQYQREDRVQ